MSPYTLQGRQDKKQGTHLADHNCASLILYCLKFPSALLVYPVGKLTAPKRTDQEECGVPLS